MGAERASGVADILPDRLDPQRADLAHGLLRLRDAAEVCESAAPRLVRRHPARDVRLGFHLDVERQLVVQLTSNAAALEKRAPSGQEGHLKPALSLRSQY
jgi:hypothetical protein